MVVWYWILLFYGSFGWAITVHLLGLHVTLILFAVYAILWIRNGLALDRQDKASDNK